MPVFAVGRAQEMLANLYKNGLASYVYTDGMANSATDIILGYRNFLANYRYLEEGVDDAVRIYGSRDRVNALKGPSIILTTAGMLEGGPVLNYITKLSKKLAHIPYGIPGGGDQRTQTDREGIRGHRRPQEED